MALVIMSRHHVMSSCHAMWSCHAIIPCHHSMSCHHVMSSCHAMWSCRAIMPRHHAMSCGSGDRRHMWLYIDVPSCVCPRVVYVYDHMARQLQVNTEPVYVSVCFDQACLCLCVCPRVCALVWCRSYGGGGGGPRVRKLWGRWRGTEGAEATGTGAGTEGAEATGAGDRGCGSYGDTGNRFITTRASMVISKHDMMT